jgi:hypothetical protein
MKRLSTALAPALMTGALIGIGAVSQAQSNVFRLEASFAGRDQVRGSTFTLSLFATQGDPEIRTTTLQPSLRFDPAYFNVAWQAELDEVDGLDFTSIGQNLRRTANIVGGPYAGPQIVNISTYGLAATNNGFTLPANTLVGNWTVTLLSNAPGGVSEIGLIDAIVTGNTSPIATGRRNTFTTNPESESDVPSFEGGNYTKPGAFQVGVVPGPSSLAVFALGGLAPAMALLRRRRAAK